MYGNCGACGTPKSEGVGDDCLLVARVGFGLYPIRALCAATYGGATGGGILQPPEALVGPYMTGILPIDGATVRYAVPPSPID